MSAFTNGFNIGFASGMFNGMFSSFSPSFISFNTFIGFNSFSNWNWGWNSFQTFYPSNFSPGIFAQNPVPTFNISTVPMWNFNTISTPSFNYESLNFQPQNTTYFYDTFVRTTTPDSKSSRPEVKAPRTTDDFNKMLDFVLDHEGGYTPNDCGQAGNKGILQSTYDTYRRKKGLAKQDVKNIADAEVKDCYYNDFYIASGANKIKDAKLALYVFDTAVNMGVGTAKKLLSQCGNNAEEFNRLRLEKYESIAANNPSKQKFLKGWKNRVNDTKIYASKEFVV